MLATDPRFSTLLTALAAAFGDDTGLEAPFTVFAPTNSAFAKIDQETLTGLLSDSRALQDGELGRLYQFLISFLTLAKFKSKTELSTWLLAFKSHVKLFLFQFF